MIKKRTQQYGPGIKDDRGKDEGALCRRIKKNYGNRKLENAGS